MKVIDSDRLPLIKNEAIASILYRANQGDRRIITVPTNIILSTRSQRRAIALGPKVAMEKES